MRNQTRLEKAHSTHVQGGDAASETELADALVAVIRRKAGARMQSAPHMVDDVVSLALLDCWTLLDSTNNIEALTRTITHRRCIDVLRKVAKSMEVQVDTTQLEAYADSSEQAPEFPHTLSDRERRTMTELQNGATCKDIAASLGVSPATIYRDVESVRNKCRNNFADREKTTTGLRHIQCGSDAPVAALD